MKIVERSDGLWRFACGDVLYISRWCWWRGWKCESANINRWVRVLLLIHAAAQNEPNISVKHSKLAFSESIIPTHRRMLEKFCRNVNRACFKKYSCHNSILHVCSISFSPPKTLNAQLKERNEYCMYPSVSRGGDLLSGVLLIQWEINKKSTPPCHLSHPPPLHKPRWKKRRWQWWSWYSFRVRGGRWERRRRGRLVGCGGRGEDFSPGLVRMGEPARYPAFHYCGANVLVFLPSDWQA